MFSGIEFVRFRAVGGLGSLGCGTLGFRVSGFSIRGHFNLGAEYPRPKKVNLSNYSRIIYAPKG